MTASVLAPEDARALARILYAVHQRQAAAREFLAEATGSLHPAEEAEAGDWLLQPASEADLKIAVAFLASTTATGVPEQSRNPEPR